MIRGNPNVTVREHCKEECSKLLTNVPVREFMITMKEPMTEAEEARYDFQTIFQRGDEWLTN
jgi:hypothetical protein